MSGKQYPDQEERDRKERDRRQVSNIINK